MPAIKVFQFGFFGSFQCRLATNPDFTAAKRQSGGWTYDLGEVAFDRIIRLSSPVTLRTGLVDHPWTDAKVIGVQTDTGGGLKPVSSPDPFMGQVLSFGQAKFDSAKGNGPGHEAIIDFLFSAGSMFKATAPAPPICNTVQKNLHERARFMTDKNAFLSTLPSNSARANSCSTTGPLGWSGFYSMMGTVDDAKLDPPTISASRSLTA